jgi:rSAM/selenodomain-associated transferase 2
MRISVVIPVLDEEARIARRLDELAALDVHEVLVVDGGSTDGTVALAKMRGARVISAARGRGIQMNAGARAATGDVLLFLHADVGLPPGAVGDIRAALADPGVVAGAFRTRTVSEGRGGPVAPLLRLADFRSRYTRLPYGDQAIFARSAAFHAVGGFPHQALMEDLELSRRLWRVGRVHVLPSRVLVSGRRFLAWPVATTLAMWLFPVLYRAGVSPDSLARWYAHAR